MKNSSIHVTLYHALKVYRTRASEASRIIDQAIVGGERGVWVAVCMTSQRQRNLYQSSSVNHKCHIDGTAFKLVPLWRMAVA
jgi:hypothetical protein